MAPVVRYDLGIMSGAAEHVFRIPGEDDPIKYSLVTGNHGHPGLAHERTERTLGTAYDYMVGALPAIATGTLRGKQVVVFPSLMDVCPFHPVSGHLDRLAARFERQAVFRQVHHEYTWLTSRFSILGMAETTPVEVFLPVRILEVIGIYGITHPRVRLRHKHPQILERACR